MDKKTLYDFYQEEGKLDSSHQRRVYSKPTSQKRFDAVKLAINNYFLSNRKLFPKILEIGCAEGLYLLEAVKLHPESICVGMDISKPKIERAVVDDRIIYLQGDWDNIPFASNSFDLVIASEVFEHSLNPKHLRDQIFRVGSTLITTVPIKEEQHTDPLKDKSGHLQVFNPESFKSLFSNIQYEYIDGDIGFILLQCSR